jgi:hypothetical protein
LHRIGGSKIGGWIDEFERWISTGEFLAAFLPARPDTLKV